MSIIIYLIFGLIVGSFLNVLIFRVPRGESIVLPPSHCFHCGHRLALWDLIPVLSFIFLKGCCRYCQARISWRYPVVELLTAGLTLLVWDRFGLNVHGLIMAVFVYALIVIAFIDLDHQIIPNVITIPMILIGLVFRSWQGEWIDAVLGGLVGGGILFLIVWIYPKGMGMGDVKYLTMAGVFLNWPGAVYSLFLGSFLGVLVILPLMLVGKIRRNEPFSFGPFLVAGTLAMTFLPYYFPDWFNGLLPGIH